MENTDLIEIFGSDSFALLDTSSSSSSESSSDDFSNFLEMQMRRRRKRRIGIRNDFSDLPSDEFQKRFRLPREMVNELANKLDGELRSPSSYNNPLSPKLQILIALRYYATGSYQSVLGDLFGVSQKAVSKCIANVSKAIARLAAENIKMPASQDERANMNYQFYKIAKIPQVVGVIDGTHIPIEIPGGENAELFRNRKGYFSINTQVVVDPSMKIIDVVARWPGSNHDQSIFNFSQLKIRFESGEFGQCVLLGDAGYACKSYLITPLSSPETIAEHRFQQAFIKTRLIVERTIGVWKKLFPVLATKMLCDVNTAVNVIVATCVLHNWLRYQPVPENEVLVPSDIELNNIATNDSSNFEKRSQIISTFS